MIRKVLLAAAIVGVIGAFLAVLLSATQAKPLDTILLVELLTLMSLLQIRWQVPNVRDARLDRDVSRAFPRFAVRRIDFRYATHVLRLCIAIGYLAVGVLGMLAPTVPVPPNFPFLDSAESGALGITIILGEFCFTVLSAWDFYRRRGDNGNGAAPPAPL